MTWGPLFSSPFLTIIDRSLDYHDDYGVIKVYPSI